MKKALVISFLLVAGLGLAAFAGPLSGSWCVYTGFAEFQPVSMLYFESDVTLDYTTCGWTFSSTAVIEKHGFSNLYFEASGSVGAFGFYGVLDFIPQTPSFKFMAGAANLSIAGMTVYAIGVLSNANAGTILDPDNGIGYNVGAFGDAGVCSLWVEAQFNLATTIGDLYDYGYDYVVGELLSFHRCTGAKSIGYDVLQTGCNPAWTGLDVYVEFPFACMDLITKVGFGCELGFEQVCFELDDLCLGIDWLLLDDLNICFEVQTKTVCAEIEIVVGDCVCITPYLSLIEDTSVTVGIGGISLDAVSIDYDMGQGVTFKAGHLFNSARPRVANCKSGDVAYHWDAAGVLKSSWYELCWITYDADGTLYPDEYYAVLIDGDACCGGAFSVSVFNWFDTTLAATSFMDWVQTRASLEIGLGANTTIGFAGRLGLAGLQRIDVWACFTF